jgi:hypothetical protein
MISQPAYLQALVLEAEVLRSDIAPFPKSHHTSNKRKSSHICRIASDLVMLSDL